MYFCSSATTMRTACREVPSQIAAHLKTGSPLKAEEIAGFEPETADLQSGVVVGVVVAHYRVNVLTQCTTTVHTDVIHTLALQIRAP